MFGDKLKKLRTDNNLTQEELAGKIMVTRTAVSKWETNKGYPSIDSLKELSNLFGISIDELISDEDVQSKRLLDEAESRKFYFGAIVFLGIATASALIAYFMKLPYLNYISAVGVIGYLVMAYFAKPKYKRLDAKKVIVPYIISRLIVLAVIIIVMVSAFVNI